MRSAIRVFAYLAVVITVFLWQTKPNDTSFAYLAGWFAALWVSSVLRYSLREVLAVAFSAAIVLSMQYFFWPTPKMFEVFFPIFLLGNTAFFLSPVFVNVVVRFLLQRIYARPELPPTSW